MKFLVLTTALILTACGDIGSSCELLDQIAAQEAANKVTQELTGREYMGTSELETYMEKEFRAILAQRPAGCPSAKPE